MIPTKSLQGQSWKPWTFIGIASVGLAALSAQPASALSSYGFSNLPSGPVGTANGWGLNSNDGFLRVFQMGAADAYLQNFDFAYFTTVNSNVQVALTLFEVTGTTATTATVGPALASSTVTLSSALTGSTSSQPASVFGNYLFKYGKSYGISFQGAQNGTPVALSGSTTAVPFTTAGGIKIPIVANQPTGYRTNDGGSSYFATSSTDSVQWSFMEANFTPVPAPALMGFSSLSGLMVYSRRLRSRIKGSAA